MNFLSQQGNEDIRVIVTTRGLPVAISKGFFPPASHARSCIQLSVEAALSQVGMESSLYANPYYAKLGVSFEDFLQMGGTVCSPGGQSFVGKMFLVSRLDSSDLDDYCDQSSCSNTYNSVDEIEALIQRSQNLEVNKRAVTLVVDDYENGYPFLYDGARFGYYMQQRDWCVYYDQSCKFLHGPGTPADDATCGNGVPGCGEWEQSVEGEFADYPEIVRVTMGRNHRWDTSESMCVDYVRHYDPHPAALFLSIESYNGLTIRTPCACGPGGNDWNHGQVLDWIAAGGAFTAGYLIGPSGGGPIIDANFVVANLYEHGLTWGEAIWSGMRSFSTTAVPIGDPLARVKVYDPDINQDGVVDIDDLMIVMASFGSCPTEPDPCPADINGDGVVDVEDINLIDEAWGRSCDYPAPPVTDWPIIPYPDVYGFQRCGDANGDRMVDENDYDDVSEVLGMSAVECPAADVNHDGWVDEADLAWIQSNLGRCRGDANGDCAIDVNDLLAVMGALCSDACDCSNNPQFNFAADLNCDCQIDTMDMMVILQNWNEGCPDSCE